MLIGSSPSVPSCLCALVLPGTRFHATYFPFAAVFIFWKWLLVGSKEWLDGFFRFSFRFSILWAQLVQTEVHEYWKDVPTRHSEPVFSFFSFFNITSLHKERRRWRLVLDAQLDQRMHERLQIFVVQNDFYLYASIQSGQAFCVCYCFLWDLDENDRAIRSRCMMEWSIKMLFCAIHEIEDRGLHGESWCGEKRCFLREYINKGAVRCSGDACRWWLSDEWSDWKEIVTGLLTSSSGGEVFEESIVLTSMHRNQTENSSIAAPAAPDALSEINWAQSPGSFVQTEMAGPDVVLSEFWYTTRRRGVAGCYCSNIECRR